MRKKILCIVFLLVIGQICVFAQIIKVSNGLSVSSIKGETEVFDFFNEYRYDYSGFIGLNYCYHNYFFLSSEIGYVSKGGKRKYEIWEMGTGITGTETIGWLVDDGETTKSVNYLHLNTTFRIKFPAKNYYFYAGVGPKVDFLIGNDVILSDWHLYGLIKKEKITPPSPSTKEMIISNNMETVIFENYTLNRILFGLKPEIGFDYCFADKFMLGINASYHINTGNVGKCNFSKLDSQELVQKNLYGKTFLFMLTFGYKL